jgi:hypothetical protein
MLTQCDSLVPTLDMGWEGIAAVNVTGEKLSIMAASDQGETWIRVTSYDLSQEVCEFGQSGWRKGVLFLTGGSISLDGMWIRREMPFKQKQAHIDRRYGSTTEAISRILIKVL